MLEPGDTIPLYVPRDNEREAYVISAVHLEKGKERWYSTERTTPDHKSIMNKYGKEVLFTPRSLELTNNKGMGVWIVDDVGIEIFSNKHVEIYSLNSIQIKSEKNEIRIIAPERILLVQGNTHVILKENVVLKGAQTNIQ